MIVGSGPAAAGAAIACANQPGVSIRILDVGARLEPHRENARARLALRLPEAWNRDDVADIVGRPVATGSKGPPQKRSFGSDFSFRNEGQRDSVIGVHGANDAVISGAYGGFSTVWGAQVMPFSRAVFEHWPISADEMYEHYRAVLTTIPFAAEPDDLAELFPLLAPASPLPRSSERTRAVLARYNHYREQLRASGVLFGHARLALDSPHCVLCGLCMSGCPYQLIYSAAHTFDQLCRAGHIEYLPGHLAVHVEEEAGQASVLAKELTTGKLIRFSADRVFLAAGAFGTTRLVAASQGLYGRSIPMFESAQFVLPFVSRDPTDHDPRQQRDFSLNQFNAAITLPDGLSVPQLHFYTYDPSFDDQLPGLFRTRWGKPLTPAVLRRLSVAFGYLPSWASSRLTIQMQPSPPGELPSLTVSGSRIGLLNSPMLRAVVGRLFRAARYVDLWPLVPLLTVSAPAKSYHCGGSFPHADEAPLSQLRSDVLGRVGSWRHVHAIDGSVLPSIAANTFTLTVMANAHRIATASLRG